MLFLLRDLVVFALLDLAFLDFLLAFGLETTSEAPSFSLSCKIYKNICYSTQVNAFSKIRQTQSYRDGVGLELSENAFQDDIQVTVTI